jgi:isopenicillin N synthase-like dioxygenase
MAGPNVPSDTTKKNVALGVISLQSLINGDPSTEAMLLKACTDLGFFYLDCVDGCSGRIMEDVQAMYSLATNFYDLPQGAKSEWLVDRDHDEHLVMG